MRASSEPHQKRSGGCLSACMLDYAGDERRSPSPRSVQVIALGEFALPLSLFTDEQLDDDSRPVLEVDVAILLVGLQHTTISSTTRTTRTTGWRTRGALPSC